MPILTAFILAAFAAYSAGWYFGYVEGNFALLLFLAVLVSGCYWLAERLVFLPRRRRAAAQLEHDAATRNGLLTQQGIAPVQQDLRPAQARLLMQPWWLDWTAGLFPVILAVFLLRSFVVEPFKIPSASMVPTLEVGDLILVNKFTYGLRLPVVNTKLTAGTPPARGDVMVFRFPPKPSQDYIKRVIGIPGDEVVYLNKRLTVNGQPVVTTKLPDYFDKEMARYFQQQQEQLGARSHRTLGDPATPSYVVAASDFPFRQNCSYSVEGVRCKVPEGHYFMMGDNRDNSLDSRAWGFVPEANIVGKAFFIWMNFSDLQRIGPF